MSSFHLQIVTPDGLFFDGEAESLDVRATTGGVTILPRHINYVTPLGMGVATVKTEGKVRKAACIGGMLACPTPSSSSRRQSSAAHSCAPASADTQIRTDSKRPPAPRRAHFLRPGEITLDLHPAFL